MKHSYAALKNNFYPRAYISCRTGKLKRVGAPFPSGAPPFSSLSESSLEAWVQGLIGSQRLSVQAEAEEGSCKL